jgi:isochorismate hydrolase
MQALIVVDAQNEEARRKRQPIAWVRHYNRPNESPAFVPGSWGAEFSPGLGPKEGSGNEILIEKDVFGAFTGTRLEDWLRSIGANRVLIVGFYAHMCLSTSVREALIRGFEVFIDPAATGACDLEHDVLGRQTAEQVVRSALLQLTNMGAQVIGTALETGGASREYQESSAD